MSNVVRILVVVAVAVFGDVSIADAREFGSYECTDDCSGHAAGYEWARSLDIENPSDCEAILARNPNRTSFYEGCLVYTEDPLRGSEYDDEGQETGNGEDADVDDSANNDADDALDDDAETDTGDSEY